MSGRQQGESDGIRKSKTSSKDGAKSASAGKDAPRTRVVRKQRTADLGRALRSIYDDTLRESVPDDLKELLGKLS